MSAVPLDKARDTILERVNKIREESGQVERVDCETEPEIFKDHPGQRKAWGSFKRIVALFAGWQSGKTTPGPPWLLREIARRGAGEYAILAPNHPLLSKKALPETLKYLRSKLVEGTDFVHKIADRQIVITPKGGLKLYGESAESVIFLVHCDSAKAVEAFTAKAIWVDEAGQLSDEVKEAIDARAAVMQARILYTSRPYEFNWFVTEIWNKREIDPQLEVINFSSYMNPAFPKEEYDRQKLLLPPWRFRMKYDGIPTKPAGAIYDCFEKQYEDENGNVLPPRKHMTVSRGEPLEITYVGNNVCKRFDIPKDWPRYSGHDFGDVNTAAVFVAKDPETCRLYIHRAYHTGRKTTKEHVDQFRARQQLSETAQVKAWGGAPSEDKTREDFAKHKWPIARPPIKDVKEGIDRTYSLLKMQNLVIFDDLDKLITDFESYSWELDPNGEPIEGKIADKATYHRLDAARYLCCAVYEGIAEEMKVANRFNDPEQGQEPEFATEYPVEIEIRQQKEEEEFMYLEEMGEVNPFEHLGWE